MKLANTSPGIEAGACPLARVLRWILILTTFGL